MKIKFNDGTIKSCAAPTEQKLFKNTDGKQTSVGWALRLNILESVTSDDLDVLLVEDNISELEFLSDDEKKLFLLSGYSGVVSTTIRHSESAETAYAEIQLSKGV